MLNLCAFAFEMNARKKPWKRSAFSQLDITTKSSDDVVPAKRTRSASGSSALLNTATPQIKSATFETPARATTASATVDLTRCDDNAENQSAKSSPPAINSDWMDNFTPSNSDELAVHVKKTSEVRDWLRHCDAMRQKYAAQICLLTGPAGAGKTAAVHVLAREAGYEVQEWINPTDCDMINALGDQPCGSAYAGSQLEAFKSYLLRASRYKSLLAQHQKRLLLVEDFPNVLLTDVATTFENLLEEYMLYGKSPLVFIVADSKSRGLNISYKLFPDQLKTKLRIEHISFNPIAATIMQKSMKRFCTLMQKQHSSIYKVPTQSVVDSIVVCAQGDIRNALINLHFASLKGQPNIPTRQLDMDVSVNKGRKRKTQSTLKSIGRDENITTMHALGRVLNPKTNGDKCLVHCPEEIAESFSTEPQQFVSFLHANFLPHFHEISQVVPAIDDMSSADLLLREYRDEALTLIGINLAVRSCMVSNVNPISGWMPVRGPKRNMLQEQATAAEQKLLGATFAGISKTLYASDYKSFVKYIAERTHVMNDSQNLL